MRGVLTVILAGGKGTRLEPLTRDRAKPAVPFGGLYRIIDFTLSNCINSGLRRILVAHAVQGPQPRPAHPRRLELPQPRTRRIRRGAAAAAAHRRDVVQGHRRRHLSEHLHDRKREPRVRPDPGRRSHLQDGLRQHDPRTSPAQRRRDDRLHSGAARGREAVRRHAGRRRRPRGVVPGEAPGRGPMPGDPKHASASMGIYVFNARLMFELLCQDAARPRAITTSARTSSRR